jgi:hypothetical protein
LLVTGYVTQQSYNILNEDICHDNNRLENAKIKRKITHFTSLGQLLKKVKEKEKHHIMKKIMLPTKKAQKNKKLLKIIEKEFQKQIKIVPIFHYATCNQTCFKKVCYIDLKRIKTNTLRLKKYKIK